MKFSQSDKVILFGGSRVLSDFANYLVNKEKHLKLAVFSAERHLGEVISQNGTTLEAALRKYSVPCYSCSDINRSKSLQKEIAQAKSALGIAFGAAWIFKKRTVKLFPDNHLLDFMGIDLPRYRGGAHYSWQIMHTNRKACANLQVVEGGKESFHKGRIIMRKEYGLPLHLRKPRDYFDFIRPKEIAFLKNFWDGVKNGREFELQNLDESKSSCYPFLFTKVNGAIDWRWSGRDIYVFVNAFDDPYPGAFTRLGGKKVFLKNAGLLPSEDRYHPFTSGIVMRKNEKGVFIAAHGNLLLIRTVLDERGQDVSARVETGDRFFTPQRDIERALIFRAKYNSSGIIV